MELEHPEFMRGIFHGAMQAYLIRLSLDSPSSPGNSRSLGPLAAFTASCATSLS